VNEQLITNYLRDAIVHVAAIFRQNRIIDIHAID